jgi:hypothetical protein
MLAGVPLPLHVPAIDVPAHVALAVLGPTQLTLGSDFPFDMGVEDPVDRLEADGFDATTTDAIRGGNAMRLLGVPRRLLGLGL